MWCYSRATVRNMRDVIPVSMVRYEMRYTILLVQWNRPTKSEINWYEINQKCARERKRAALRITLYTLRYTPSLLEHLVRYLNPERGIDAILAVGILLPSIEIVHEPSEPRDLCDCLRESASYVLLRVHKKELYIPSTGTPQGQWVGAVRERPYGEAWDDRDANSFCSLPRLPRPFLRMQIVGGRRGRGMRSLFWRRAPGRKNKGAEDYERIFIHHFKRIQM